MAALSSTRCGWVGWETFFHGAGRPVIFFHGAGTPFFWLLFSVMSISLANRAVFLCASSSAEHELFDWTWQFRDAWFLSESTVFQRACCSIERGLIPDFTCMLRGLILDFTCLQFCGARTSRIAIRVLNCHCLITDAVILWCTARSHGFGMG